MYWNTFFNFICKIEATIKFKFDVQRSCRARKALSFHIRYFSNLFSKLEQKLKIITPIIQNV